MAINSLGSSAYLYGTQTLAGVGQNTPAGLLENASALAGQLVSAIESGDLSLDDLATALSERFGDAADSVFTEEGVDTDALAALLADAMEVAQGLFEEGQIPPPPPKETLDVASLAEQLTAKFGEEAASSVISEDNQINFEALAALLESEYESTSGTIINTSA